MTTPAPDTFFPPPVIAWLTVAALIAGLTAAYFGGTLDPLIEWAAERFFRYEAKAEEKALAKAGSREAESFLKERLQKNPVVSSDRLNEIQAGLGDEAVEKFGKDGLGKVFG